LIALKFYRIRRRLRSLQKQLTELRDELQDDREFRDTVPAVEVLRDAVVRLLELWEEKNAWRKPWIPTTSSKP